MVATLICVFSESCGNCRIFKQQYYAEFMRKLKAKFPTLKVEIINVRDMDELDHEVGKYHKDLAQYINWVPCFILTNSSYDDKRSRLEAVIFNGVRMGNSYQVDREHYKPAMPDNIIEWIESYLGY